MKNYFSSYPSRPFRWRLYTSRMLVLLTLLMVQSVALQAQSETITLQLKEVSIETVLKAIKDQSNVNIIYNHEELSNASKIDISVEKVSVEEAIKKCLEGTEITFKKINNTYVITPGQSKQEPDEVMQDLPRSTIRGQVMDRDSKVTLPFATVQVMDSDPLIGTTTDLDGNFRLDNLPVGRYTLKVSYVGYNDGYVTELQLGSAKEAIVSVALSEQVQSLGEIVVSAGNRTPVNEMATVSAKSFSAEETKRYAASISDPARMVQNYAGVSGTDDASNEIVIRGNSPNWLLWRLEGVEIPIPNHFAEEGYVTGAVSILSSNVLGTSDFLTGAFPAEYGNALSGVFDLSLRNGNNLKDEYTFQIGLLGVDLSAEGPFKKDYNGSFLFNYRYSTLSILNDLNIEVSENALPNYQDLSFKINLPTRKAGTFSIWGVGGLSDTREKFLPDTTAGEQFIHGYEDNTDGGMYASGITHTIFVDDQSFIRTVVSSSSNFSSNQLSQMDSLGVMTGRFNDELSNSALRFNTYYNRKLSGRTTLRTGLTLNRISYSYFGEQREDGVSPWQTHLDSDGHTNLLLAFTQFRYKFSENISLTTGINYTHFALSNDNVLEPRAGLTIGLRNGQQLNMGYGRHTRHENLPVYFIETVSETGEYYQPNTSLKLTRSNHFVAGYARQFQNDISLKIDAYYQRIGNLPVPNNPDKYWSPIFGGASNEDTLANIGKGRNYGIEFTLQKYFSNSYYFMLTSSIFDSKYQAANGQWYNTRFNTNHVNNLIGGREIKLREDRMLSLNGKLLWSGGKRLIPINLQESISQGETVLDFDRIYSTKTKDYIRLDLGVKLHFYKPKSEHIILLDIQNVMNRLNTWTEFYNSETEKIEDYPMAGIIPIISYRIEF